VSTGEWALVLVVVFVVLPIMLRAIGAAFDAVALAQSKEEQRRFERDQGLAPGEVPRVLPMRKR
jgi:hypothetical protein